ncbi:hypothetical protein NA57DRAFT_61047 [Rhizodiscina lignyota]|uniref:Uncharacterized protein n=1 Tax=Rhizodiscina lignyota TaxID=1504668 RepID=A0A9P4I6V8_9PEZI|nr:hypothetical protein NA57DRAFT_61047 [Rhizodiscina lignyota]
MTSLSHKRRLSIEDSSATKVPREEHQLPGLLRLPLELRLQIYGYLLPDVPVIPVDSEIEYAPCRPHILPIQSIQPRRPGHYEKIATRKDRAKCSTSVMRINKRIHQETSDFLDRTLVIEIEVSSDGIKYLKSGRVRCIHSSSSRDKLEKTIRRYHKFYITLFPLPKPDPEAGLRCETREFKEYLNWICNCLKFEAQPKQITVSYRDRHWPLNQMEECLKWHLRPFSNIRGLAAAEIIHRPIYERTQQYIERDDYSPQMYQFITRRRVYDSYSSYNQQHHVPDEVASSFERERQEKECERQKQKDRLHRVMENMAAEMRGNSALRELESLVIPWRCLCKWLRSTTLQNWDSGALGTKIQSTLVKAWDAYDEGEIELFARSVKSLEGCFDKIQRYWKSKLADVETYVDCSRDDFESMFEDNPDMKLRSPDHERTRNGKI